MLERQDRDAAEAQGTAAHRGGERVARLVLERIDGDTGDRRRVLIHLTAAGRKRAAPVLRAAKAHEARLLAPFTAEERAVIKRALDLLINGPA